MVKYCLPVAVGAVCGVISGFGIGGGTLLVIYLTAIAHMEQTTAQGVNLLYFLPTAAAALIMHIKHRLINFRAMLPAAICGCATAAGSSLLAVHIDVTLLKKLFGGFLILVGILELLRKPTS